MLAGLQWGCMELLTPVSQLELSGLCTAAYLRVMLHTGNERQPAFCVMAALFCAIEREQGDEFRSLDCDHWELWLWRTGGNCLL